MICGQIHFEAQRSTANANVNMENSQTGSEFQMSDKFKILNTGLLKVTLCSTTIKHTRIMHRWMPNFQHVSDAASELYVTDE